MDCSEEMISMDTSLAPLAERMRPRTLDEMFGQQALIGKGRLLRRAIEADRLNSAIFWGPPGCGKTTLAKIIADNTQAVFHRLNAVTAGVADVREVIREAEDNQLIQGRKTLLLLDECHRWSKAQSDSILEAIERGQIRFIGSTTENPLVSMTPALVSRCRVFHFEALSRDDVRRAMECAVQDRERGLGGMQVRADRDALDYLADMSGADVRTALGALELAALTTPMGADGWIHVDMETARESIQAPQRGVDESMYYDMLSAFCKSLRGSDSDAAMYWFAALLSSGVDPWLVMRRIIVHASEDVGLAGPNVMLTAAAAAIALEKVGLPEARIPMAQAVITLCESPKSDSVVRAVAEAFEEVAKNPVKNVPVHLRDTHYAGAERAGSGKGYKYPHDDPTHFVPQQYLPDGMEGREFYHPTEMGREAGIRENRRRRKERRV